MSPAVKVKSSSVNSSALNKEKKTLKRKREQDELEKLEKAVAEHVGCSTDHLPGTPLTIEVLCK